MKSLRVLVVAVLSLGLMLGSGAAFASDEEKGGHSAHRDAVNERAHKQENAAEKAEQQKTDAVKNQPATQQSGGAPADDEEEKEEGSH